MFNNQPSQGLGQQTSRLLAFGLGNGAGAETTIGGGGSGSIRKRNYYPIIEPVEDFEQQKIELIRRQDAEIEEMIIMLITKGFI